MCPDQDLVTDMKALKIETDTLFSPLQWFKFNDHKVELATISEVLGAQAYLLFYIIRSLA